MPSITIPRKLIWIAVTIALGMAGTGVAALVAEVIGAGKSRATQAVQMQSLIASIDRIAENLDVSVKIGKADRNELRSRISILEQHASRTNGDVSGILRVLHEHKERLAALERGETPFHMIDPEGG